MAVPIERVSTTDARNVPEESWDNSGDYRFLVQTSLDEDGIFSAIALNLPGTGSCGPTRDIALERFREAAAGIVESYIESGESIPWKTIQPSEVPSEAKWISLNG